MAHKMNRTCDIVDGSIRALGAQEGGTDERTFELSFSSDTPIERGGYTEILSHEDGAVDLTRLNEIGTVLLGHNPDAPVARIDKAWIENGRGRAQITFDTSERSEQARIQVAAGTLRAISVGYRVREEDWEDVCKGERSADGRYEGPCSIAKRWAGLEISIVSVPADNTVGFGRELDLDSDARGAEHRTPKGEQRDMGAENTRNEPNVESEATGTREEKENEEKNAPPQGGGSGTETRPVDKTDEEKKKEEGARAERARITAISSMCRAFGLDPQPHIDGGRTVEDTRAAVLEQLMRDKAPLNTRGSISVGEDEHDKFVRAAADGLLMRSGLTVEKPADGANEMRGMSLRDLGMECLEREGHSARSLRRMDNTRLYKELVRGFYNPEAAFPAMLDQTIEKAYVAGLKTVPVTFDKWTKKGTLTDFKRHDNHYIAGPVGEFLEVPESGELKADIFEDAKLPQRQLKTFGRKFTLSRKAFIDDDIGLVTSLPARYAASARKTINKQVYDILVGNPVIFDGLNLFCAEHKNSIKPDKNTGVGTGLTYEAVQTMVLALGAQTTQHGEPAIITPKYLIVPTGMGFEARTLFESPTISTEGNTQAANPMYKLGELLTVVEDPTINLLAGAGQPAPWFLVGEATDDEFIEVDYLNGREEPYMDRMQSADQLGFQWRIYLDWGISVMDYRGVVRNPGKVIATPLEMM